MNTILVQDIETFETIITLPNMAAFDEWMDDSSEYGIVSLDTDADGEHAYVALVVSDAGPDYDMNDASQEDILAVIADTVNPEALLEEAEQDAQDGCFAASIEKKMIARDIKKATITSKPRKQRKSKTPKTNTLTKGKTMKNHEILAAFITKYPGVTRTDVFQHQDLLQPLRTEAQRRAIAAGDKLEIKRWNSCINRFIRKIRRDGTDIRVVGQGKSATYTIGQPDGQLELPFDDAAEARNAAINGNESAAVVEEAPIPPKQDAMRLVEEPNQSLDFESLLAQLDDDAALVLTDDQVAFKAAQEMIK